MAVPNIVAFRIDERLIHGQGQLWIKALGVNTVIVANDSASEDSMQQTLMKAVVPKTIAMRFFSIQHTCDVIMKASPKQTIFIVCKTPEDALKLVAGGVPVKEINVGNIHHAPVSFTHMKLATKRIGEVLVGTGVFKKKKTTKTVSRGEVDIEMTS